MAIGSGLEKMEPSCALAHLRQGSSQVYGLPMIKAVRRIRKPISLASELKSLIHKEPTENTVELVFK